MANNNTSMHLREEVPTNIVKGARLESIMNTLLYNFDAGEQKVNKFFDQTYFRGEESLINKLIEIDGNLDFDGIKDEGINLAILLYDNWMRDFRGCVDKLSDNVKTALIKQIHDKVQNKIGLAAPYNDFNDPDACGIPGDANVLPYMQKVIDYLKGKEGATHGKKSIEVLKEVTITNNDLNSELPTGDQIPAGISLGDATISPDSKNSFNALLSFEIGKEADRAISIANNISEKLEGLFTNSFPAINTVVGENDEYKYDESKLGDEYLGRLQSINDDANLSDDKKKEQIKALRREYYIKYLKTKNTAIGNALEQLYNNDFDYSKIDEPILQGYLDKVVDLRLRVLSNSGIITSLGLDWSNVDEFTDFYKNLAKKSETDIQLGHGLNLPVEKEIIEGKNQRLKDIDEFGPKEKAYDTLPIKFKIRQSNVDSLPIDMDDRVNLLKYLSRFKTDEENYIIEGDNVGMIIYLFFMVNSGARLEKFDLDKQQEVENLLGKANSKEKGGKNDENNAEGNENEGNNGEGNEEGASEESTEGNEVYTSTKFKEDIEKLGPCKFENGSEIWIPAGASELPGGGYQWMKIKISNIDIKKGTFTGTVFGGELKFSKNEGKSKTFKMDKSTLEQFKKTSNNVSGSEDKVYLLPNPNNSDFNSFRDSLNGKLGTSILAFPVEGVTWNGNKFMQKITDDEGKEKEVEVKYFGAISDDKSTYKIDYNPISHTFTVSSSFNGDEKGKDGKSEKKRFSYKRDMDWNNFLIFFTQKGLVPQTQEESNSAIARQDQEFKMVNGGRWKLNWFSINNIKNVFKTIKGNIKKKIDDYNKAQDEKLEDILVEDRGIYNKLAGVLGFIPSMKSGLGELQQEHYNNRDNQTWKKIEGYLKLFQSDPDFGTTFDQVPPFAKILGGKSYKEFINGLNKPNSSRSKEDIHKAAAILLANIEKGGSPYRGLSGEENSGLWVRVLLGNAHYEQFMRDKQKCINDLKSAGKEKDQIQDVLATCEMDYIINNVSGANGKLKYFGSHEGRGIPGEENTDYIDNPSKRLLSNQFADKLKGSYKGWFNKSSVEESFGKITHNDFNLAKADFERLIKSSRFPGAIANLKKMFMLAKTPEQQSEYQKCFLVYMLSGVLDVNGKKDLRKQTYQWAKTMSFLPGMLAKETNHSEKVVTLLDDWSGGDFSKSVKSYFHEGDSKNGKLNIGSLINELNARWDIDKMNAFEKYSKSEFLSKSFPKNSVLDKLQKSALNTDIENIDNSLLDNPLLANSGGLLSNINVVDDRILFKNGEFEGKDPDERNNRKLFWSKVKDEIESKKANNVDDLTLLLSQYFSRFRFSDREEVYKWIKTASVWEKEVGKEKFFENDEHIRDSMGIIGPKEIESIIRYTFKGHTMYNRFNGRLPDELNDVLDAFQTKFKEAFDNKMFETPDIISKVFDISKPENIQPYGLGSWSKYNRAVTGREYVIDDEGGSGDPKDSKKKERNRVKRNFTSGNFINKKIADMENSFKRLPDKQYKSYVNTTLGDLMSRFSDAA